MKPIIQVRDLKKTFISQTRGIEHIKALDGIDLDIFEGEILGILGPNGAGKTTLLNILSTLLLPDSGRIEINHIVSVPKNSMRLRRILNMSSGHPNFPWSLTVKENLTFYALLYGLRGYALEQKVSELIDMFDLKDFTHQRFDELSSGTKQKLSLAKALLNDPKIIFLDEPTVGLDPDVAIKIRERILDIYKKKKLTILLTTHNMQEADTMSSRIAFIHSGTLLRLAKPGELKIMEGKDNLEEVFVKLAHQVKKVASGQVSVFAPCAIGSVDEDTSEEQESLFDRQRIGLWIRRTLAFTYRNYIFAVSNFFSFMELLFWPIVSLISIGLLGDFLELREQALAFVMTGAITAGILQVTQLDVAYSLLYEVWSKSMKHTFLTPVGISENLFGSWLVGIVRGSFVFGILSVCAMMFFGFQFPAFGVLLIFLLGVFASALLLGLLVSVLILIFGQKAEITAWMFAYLFMLVSGIYYPVSTLPKFFFYVAQAIPMTYFLEYFCAHFGFTPILSHGLFKGFGLIILYLALGLRVMNFAFHQARRKGTIVRLSE
ncbi:MAG: ABC transporter ATP-binding protein/permease [Candidatus Omnitrophota bacterium]